MGIYLPANFQSSLLWGQVQRATSMGSRFRGESAQFGMQQVLNGLMLLGVIALAIWGLSLLLNRQDRTRRHLSHRALFRSLANAHALNFAQKRLLKELARAHRLAQPARLFLEPERFDAARLTQSLARRQGQLDTLRSKLFGDLSGA